MSDNPENQNASEIRTALIVAFVGLAVMAGTVYFLIVFPSMVNRRKQEQREIMKENLKQLGIALHNYQQTHSPLPAATKTDEEK